jgi:hypothetical protein
MPMPTARKTPPTTAAKTRAGADRAPVGFVPTGEVMALFKAVELGAKGAAKLADWLRSEGPVVVQILDASVQGEAYVAHFRATNQTVHGLYVLGAELSWPVVLNAVPLGRPPERRIGLGETESEALPRWPLPVHVAPAASFEFFIAIPLPATAHLDAGLWHRRIGKAKLHFQLLNQSTPDNRDIDFAILLPAN